MCILASVTVLTKPQDLPKVTYPKLAKHAVSPRGFIPKGWKLESVKRGDLNGDGRVDIALVLHQNDPRNIIHNEGSLGADQFDANPRILAVALADGSGDGYTLVLENHSLIPVLDLATIDDPFKAISISNGSLKVSLRFWASAGSYFASETTYVFRYSADCFRLIGYDSVETQRNSGHTDEISVDYVTGRVKESSSNFASKRKRVKWSRLSSVKQVCIDQIGESFDPERP
jgi:hypothetical protein